MCWSSSGDPSPRPAREADKKNEREILHLGAVGGENTAPRRRESRGFCGGYSSPGREESRICSGSVCLTLLCWLSLLGMPQAGLHGTCKTSVEKQMRGKWSKPTNISTGTLAGGLQPLSPPISLRCIRLQPSQGLGCSRWMETGAGAVQSAGRAW